MDVIRSLELALLDTHCDNKLFVAGLLLMLWAGLRWSDVQRLSLSALASDQSCLRGACWRTRGMPWACVRPGVVNQDWTKFLMAEVHGCCAKSFPTARFLVDPQWKTYVLHGCFGPVSAMLGGVWQTGCFLDTHF